MSKNKLRVQPIAF